MFTCPSKTDTVLPTPLPEIINCGETLTSTDAVFSVNDPDAPAGRLYQWFINGGEAGGPTTSTSISRSGLPSDGSQIIKEVHFSDDGVNYQVGDFCECTAISEVTPGPITINNCGSTLQGAEATFSWNDPGFDSNTFYDFWLGSTPGSDDIYDHVGNNVFNGNSVTVLTVPTDGRTLHKTLRYTRVGDFSDVQEVRCTCTAADLQVQAEKAPNFQPDRAFGQVTSVDWNNWMEGTAQGVSNEGDLRTLAGELTARYRPASNGSARTQAFGNLPARQCYEVEQTVRLEPGWDFVKAVKLGAGLGGGSPLVSGGNTATTGHTVRFALAGNDNTSEGGDNLIAYAYYVNRPEQFGAEIPFNFKMPIDQDVTMRMRQCMNDPGQSNGTLEGWVNGTKAFTETGIQWMTGTPTIDRCIFSTFYGGNDSSFAPSRTVQAQFRDIKYI